jgi:hypothetical protein
MAVAALAAPAFPQAVPDAPPQPRLHVTASFDLLVHASYSATMPLFGSDGERAWAGKHWNPSFIYPQQAGDIEGSVFTVQHGTMRAVWVTTLFDVNAGRIQYAYFLPDLMVTVIDLRFDRVSADSTSVHVTYTRTALTPEGNQHVAAMNENDKNAGSEWQQQIDAYLAAKNSIAKP